MTRPRPFSRSTTVRRYAARGRLVQHAETDLARLHERGRLTGVEVEQLREILRVVANDSAPTDKLDRVDEILRQVAESGAGPFALTIASIAADSSRDLVERGAESGVDTPSTAVVVVADVAGGIGGVFVGDELCGPVCGVMGGVAGAAGLSMLAQDHL